MVESEDLLRALRERLVASPFHTWAGMDVVEASVGEVTVAMDVLEGHVNLQGLVHGGMLAILADTACGLSIRAAMEPGRLHVTTDLDIHYLAPAKPGRLLGRGKAIKVGRTLAFAEASIEDGEGRLLARAQSRFSVSGREPGAD
ncbi:MAG: PaaI family thioesterase [Actinobacteria bacterium]|nr:PaaI family thioesterase [Actinomycetota bacterium]MBA3738305.1 PaaI family thioesterase [Actinomycetota bacterium]